MPKFIAAPVAISVATFSTYTWNTVDLSAYLPRNAVGVMLCANSTNTGIVVGARKYGSTDDLWLYLSGPGFAHHCFSGVSTDLKVDLYTNTNSTGNLTYYLLGYFTQDEAVFLTNASPKGNIPLGVYTTYDVASESGLEPAIGAIIQSNNSYQFFARHPSSTDNFPATGGASISQIVGLNGSKQFQVFNNGAHPLYVMGYIKSGMTWNVNAVDRSPGTFGAFSAITTPAGAFGALYLARATTTDVPCTVRNTSWTAYDPYAVPSNVRSAQIPAPRNVEAKVYDSTLKVYEQAYFAPAGWGGSKGFNFRATAGYVADGADQAYVVGDTYPTTRMVGGEAVTFGWEAQGPDPLRERTSAAPYKPELSGLEQLSGSGSEAVFRVDLPATGDYMIHVGACDPVFGNKVFFGLRDNTTEFVSVAETALGSTDVCDAAGNIHSTGLLWRQNASRVVRTFGSTTFRFALKVTSSLASIVSHITITPITGPYVANAKTQPASAAVLAQTSPAFTSVSGSTLFATMESRLSSLGTFTSITDTYGNAWIAHPNSPQVMGDSYTYAYYCVNAKGGAGHTVTFTSTGASYKTATLVEIRNAARSGSPVGMAGAVDGIVTAHAAAIPSLSPGGLLVAAVNGSADRGMGSLLPDSGWTKYTEFPETNAWDNAVFAKPVTSAADVLGFGTTWTTETNMLWVEILPISSTALRVGLFDNALRLTSWF